MINILQQGWEDSFDFVKAVNAHRTINLELKEIQELLRKAERLSHLGHWKVDCVAGKTFWSQELYRLHGVSPDHFVPNMKEDWRFYHAEEKENVRHIYERALKEGLSFEFKGRLVDVHHGIHHVLVAGEGIFDTKGVLTGLFGIIQDITDRVSKELELEKAQGFLKTLINAIPDYIFVKDDQCRPVLANKAFLDLTPREASFFENTEKHLACQEHKTDHAQEPSAVEQGSREYYIGGSHSQEVSLDFPHGAFSSQGGEKSYFVKTVNFTDGENKKFNVTVARDISELEKIRRELERSEERYALAINGSRASIYDWNIKENQLFWSSQFQSLLGITNAHFVPSFEELKVRVHPHDLPGMLERLDAHLHKKIPYQSDFRLRHEDGSYLWVHSCGQAFWDAQGKAIRMVGSVTNITERKEAEIFLEELYDLSTQPRIPLKEKIEKILVKALAYYKLHVATVSRGTPAPLQVLYGFSLDPFVSAKDFLKAKASSCYLESSGNEVRVLNQLCHVKEGMTCIFHHKLHMKASIDFKVIVNEQPFGFLSFGSRVSRPAFTAIEISIMRMISRWIGAEITREHHDVQIREYARTIELSNKKLDEFAHIIAHDLREPLRGINHYAQFLMDDSRTKRDAQDLHKLQTISDLSRFMDTLLVSLLYYSRVDQVRGADKMVDLSKVLDSILHSLKVFFDTQNVRVCVVGSLPSVFGDATRLGEIFNNLIVNGVKYNAQSQKYIEIGIREDLPHGSNEKVFYVKDNGIGIPKRCFKDVFKVFTRFHHGQAYAEGTGTGLAIVKKIVEAHGGTIWMKSKETKGTTFFFTLPLSPPDG